MSTGSTSASFSSAAGAAGRGVTFSLEAAVAVAVAAAHHRSTMGIGRFATLLLIAMAVMHLFLRDRVREIVISKSGRILVAYGDDGRELLRAPIGLGRSEVGHKLREGDERTPEGLYRVCFKNPRSRFHLSFGIDYPNTADAAEGLRQGAITRQDHDAILEAHRRGAIPPWKTALGGEIFIHGGLDVHPATAGCVAIRDRDVETLFPLVDLGTPVRIEP